MASRTLHRAIAASLATVVVACGLTSCFFAEPPPEGSEESLAELADRIAAVDGIDSASIRGTADGLSFGVQTGCLS